jgi:nucleoside-diphosphate-sugar epimerase
MSTILITGATGFLGSHLLKAMLNAGHKLVILKRSTSNPWRIASLLHQVTSYDIDRVPLTQAFEDQHIDAVIHTACHYGRDGAPAHQIVETNLMLGLKLLDAATFFNTDTLLQKHLNVYTLSKKQFVEWLQQRSEQIQVVNLKLEHMYGPLDDATKFVPWVISQLAQKAPHINLTPGNQLRDFIYIDDVVAAYLATLHQAAQLPSFSEFDVGTGTLTSVRQMVEMLKATFEHQHGPSHTQLNFGAVPYRDGEMMQVQVDNSALMQLGWQANTTLTTGLVKTISTLQ